MKKFKKDIKNNKAVTVSLRIDKELGDLFNQLVEINGATKSEYLRFLIERELEMEGLINGENR